MLHYIIFLLIEITYFISPVNITNGELVYINYFLLTLGNQPTQKWLCAKEHQGIRVLIQYKDVIWYCQNRKSHCGDKTVVRSYLHNGISYTGKMASLYWISPLQIWCYINRPLLIMLSLKSTHNDTCALWCNDVLCVDLGQLAKTKRQWTKKNGITAGIWFSIKVLSYQQGPYSRFLISCISGKIAIRWMSWDTPHR